MTTVWGMAIVILTLLNPTTSSANDIWVYQIGDDFNMTITQDGENNQVTGISGATKGLEGDDNTVTVHQDGQYNTVAGMLDGDDNTVDLYQGGTGESNDTIASIEGDNNNLKIWQGKKIDGFTDTTEGGDHEADVAIVGNNNNYHSAQTDQATNCCSDAHTLSADIIGNNNDVTHQQRGGKHIGDIDIAGSNNDVDLLQRGNNGHTANIELSGNGHTVDSTQRDNANHSLTLDLNNGGGAYSVTTTQENTTNQTYNLSGTCTNSNGCGIIVTQN